MGLGHDRLDELVELMLDTVCSRRETIRIAAISRNTCWPLYITPRPPLTANYASLVNYDLYGAKNRWQLVELPFLLEVLRFIFNSKLNADKQKN